MSENVRSALITAIATVMAAIISGIVAYNIAERSAKQEVENEINVESPIGSIIAFYGKKPPDGWLICDGKLVTSSHPRLKRFLIDNFGNNQLPDLRGRSPIGAGHGEGLTSRDLGQKIGDEMHTLKIEEIPSHNHGFTRYGQRRNTGNGADRYMWQDGEQVPTTNTGGSQPHNNMQPSFVVNFIIKAK